LPEGFDFTGGQGDDQNDPAHWGAEDADGRWWALADGPDVDRVLPSPYGIAGDRLWLREAWRVPNNLDDLSPKQIGDACVNAGYQKPWCPIQYEADGVRTSEKDWREFGPHPSTVTPGRYRHARFMPRWASRILLEVTDMRVERLQAISEEDARSEGAESTFAPRWYSDRYGSLCGSQHRHGFVGVWEAINGADSWHANPFVWVVSFKRITP
jgi:hypothetical protein